MGISFADLQLEIQNMLEIDDNLLSEAQKDAWYKYMDELGQAEADKVDAFSSFVRIELGRAKALREEAAALTKRAKAAESKIEKLKAHYMYVMANAGLTKVSGKTHSIRVGQTKAVAVAEGAVEFLPDEYVIRKAEPCKSAIKDALEKGVMLPGCSIVERQHLTIS